MPPPRDREPPATPTDEELCRALRSDGPAALGPLYDRYSGLVFGLAKTILTSSEEAEDLTHEIFIGLQRRCTFDPTRGALSTYLVTLTRSRALDRLRSRRRRLGALEKLQLQEAEPQARFAPLELLSLEECAQRVREGLSALPEPQRRVLELAYYRDLSQTEIALELNTPLGTVKTWTRKALLTLRDTLRDLTG
jgi:RNA polymerase sigma-70 factor, ECF subfamily